MKPGVQTQDVVPCAAVTGQAHRVGIPPAPLYLPHSQLGQHTQYEAVVTAEAARLGVQEAQGPKPRPIVGHKRRPSVGGKTCLPSRRGAGGTCSAMVFMRVAQG